MNVGRMQAVASELTWIDQAGSVTKSAAHQPLTRGRWQGMGWLLAAAFFLLMLTSSIGWWQASTQQPKSLYFHAAVPFAANDVALSPDGHMLAIVAYSAQANDYVLWTYEIGGQRTSSLNGTQGASYPFWSPDGKSIGFFADGKLRKVGVAGGQSQVLCDAPNGRGGTWNREGVIVFAPDAITGLSRVSAWGGSPVELTKPDASRLEMSHRWPVFLPDGKHLLYLAANFSGAPANNALFMGSLDSAEKRLLVNASSNAAYVEAGYLIYLHDKALVAQPFDKRHMVLSGEPHSLSDNVLYFPQVDRAVFTASSGGILVTQTGTGAYLSQLTWFDRNGKPVGLTGKPAWYDNVQLSPDRHIIAAEQTDPDGRNIDIWIQDPARDTTTRLTFDPALDLTPVWNPEGKRIAFISNRSGTFRLYLKNSDGSGPEQELADTGSPVLFALDWSRDGKYVLLSRGNELWYFDWKERVLKPLIQAKWVVRSAQFSPDGHWIAYVSNETGRAEVYVSPFVNANGKWQVSSAGGQEPRWRPDGKELLYLSPDGKMMAATVATGLSFEAGHPIVLFQTRRRQQMSADDLFSYDLSADGKRFLIATKLDETNAAPLAILLNWTSEMEK